MPFPQLPGMILKWDFRVPVVGVFRYHSLDNSSLPHFPLVGSVEGKDVRVSIVDSFNIKMGGSSWNEWSIQNIYDRESTFHAIRGVIPSVLRLMFDWSMVNGQIPTSQKSQWQFEIR